MTVSSSQGARLDLTALLEVRGSGARSRAGGAGRNRTESQRWLVALLQKYGSIGL